MSFNLMTVFSGKDLARLGEKASSIISLAFKSNKRSGARVVRAVLDNGTTLIKTVTASGAVLEEAVKLPAVTSIAQRNELIRELAKEKKTQECIAAMLDVSQATVSRVLNKKV